MDITERYLRGGMRDALIGIAGNGNSNDALVYIQHIQASPKHHSSYKRTRRQMERYCTFLANAKKDALLAIKEKYPSAPMFSRGRRGMAGSIVYDQFNQSLEVIGLRNEHAYDRQLTPEILNDMANQVMNAPFRPDPEPAVHPAYLRQRPPYDVSPVMEIQEQFIARRVVAALDQETFQAAERLAEQMVSVTFANGSRINYPLVSSAPAILGRPFARMNNVIASHMAREGGTE